MRITGLLIAWSLIEIALFVVIGGRIGLGWTLLEVLASGLLGVAVIRGAGVELGQGLRGMRGPGAEIGGTALVMLAGVFLILPGFFGDLVGLLLLVPDLRRRVLARLPRPRVRREMGQVIDAEAVEEAPPGGRGGPSGWTRM